MSAHASLATSGCQSLSFVAESVSHQVSTPANSTATTASFRQSGLTNKRKTAKVIASNTAATLFPLPNGASNHTAPNVQAMAMMATTRESDAPTHRITRISLHYGPEEICAEQSP